MKQLRLARRMAGAEGQFEGRGCQIGSHFSAYSVVLFDDLDSSCKEVESEAVA